jgi:hypothetical protein
MTNPDLVKIPTSLTPEVNMNQPTSGAEPPIAIPEGKSSTTAVMVHTESIPMNLNALTSLVRDRLKPGLDESLQEELAKLLNLIPELDTSYNERFIPLLEIAVLSLLSESPNIGLAKGIREDIEHRVHRSPLLTIIRGGGSPPTRVILGLGTLVYFVIPLLAIFLLSAPPQNEILGVDSSLLLLVAGAGAVGSAVSIMVRIQDFGPLKNTDPSILFFTGLFKPIIGMAFALFVFATLNAGLIPLSVEDPEKAPYFFTALAFVSGFSERFAKDIATRAENTIVSVQSAKL